MAVAVSPFARSCWRLVLRFACQLSNVGWQLTQKIKNCNYDSQCIQAEKESWNDKNPGKIEEFVKALTDEGLNDLAREISLETIAQLGTPSEFSVLKNAARWGDAIRAQAVVIRKDGNIPSAQIFESVGSVLKFIGD